MKPTLRRVTPILVLSVYMLSASGCASKTGGTALGAVGGALVGGAVGYAVGGEQGALIGAGAGAVAGGVAGYALSKTKEKQVASEKQVQEQAAQQGAPILQPVLEVRDLSVTPPTPAPGDPVTLDVGLRAVSGTEQQVTPPTVKVVLSRDGQALREQELVAENTGDVDLQSVFSVPNVAQAGIYTVSVETVPQGTIQPSRREATFEVKEAPAATAPPSGTVGYVPAAAATGG
jgi:hypothetical protein